ncbi:hypothetical protein HYQ46_002466 [Verticillium longisporum]|nr:hypothetical protein HYQ46_002466 [Verticillium longisporum]
MYERTEEEMEDLGLNDMKVENYEEKAGEMEAGDKPEEKTPEQLQHEQKNGELMDQLIDANRRYVFHTGKLCSCFTESTMLFSSPIHWMPRISLVAVLS